MKNADYRPTRFDYFPSIEALRLWLEQHKLPVSKNHDNNINTMLRATGAFRRVE